MILRRIETDPKELAAYTSVIDSFLLEQIKKRGKKLAGLKVAHLNATAQGGGVVELLRSLVPLMNDAGINASWFVTSAPGEFFEVTKKIHNLLQGQKGELTQKEKALYLECNRFFAQEMEKIKADLWVVHDPQPAGVILFYSSCPMIWRCHIDTSLSNPKIWDFLSFIKDYDKYIFSMEEYVGSYLGKEKVAVVAPAIDPLSPKNWPVDPLLADSLLANLDVDPDRPIMSQISRFDPWKDPLGVIEAYHLAKKGIPRLQLILTGEMATDDPEGQRIFEEVEEVAGKDPDIHLWPDRVRNDLKINAIQTASDVILQKSIKEGFGLTVAEAMWKAKVVIGGNCGGIKLQIKNGENGFLVNTPQEAAEKIIWVLKNPQEAKKIGIRARESVRRNFLIPRLLNNYLKLFEDLQDEIEVQKSLGEPIPCVIVQ